MKWLRQHKHRLLLAALVFALLLQPIAAVELEIVGFFTLLAVFLAVFERRSAQIGAIAIGLPAIAANVLGTIGPESGRFACMIAFHGLMIGFMGLAVVTILLDIFRSTRIQLDHVIGAFSGFILAAVAWGNLYLLIYLLDPNAYRIESYHQVENIELRRFLFNHLSFASLTTLDHEGITTIAPYARTLQWFEALFGQFYFAVFIGQLVGLTMVHSQAAKSSTPPTIRPHS